MKQHTFLSISCALLTLFLSSCSSKQYIASESIHENRRDQVSPNTDTAPNPLLSDLLRRVPGVEVRGFEGNMTVVVRGNKSIQGDNSPLYVLDGVPLGRDFNSVAGSIDTNQVSNIRVLKGPQTARYGSRGQNGVIEIRTKN